MTRYCRVDRWRRPQVRDTSFSVAVCASGDQHHPRQFRIRQCVMAARYWLRESPARPEGRDRTHRAGCCRDNCPRAGQFTRSVCPVGAGVEHNMIVLIAQLLISHSAVNSSKAGQSGGTGTGELFLNTATISSGRSPYRPDNAFTVCRCGSRWIDFQRGQSVNRCNRGYLMADGLFKTPARHSMQDRYSTNSTRLPEVVK